MTGKLTTTSGIQVLELAGSRGIAAGLITRYPKSPAAKPADVVLRLQRGPLPVRLRPGEDRDGCAVQKYCRRNREGCEDNIQRIASALSDQRL